MGPTPASESDFGRRFVSIAEALRDEPDVPHTAEQVVSFACETLDIDYAGVMLFEGGRMMETVAASHAIVDKADKLQIQLQEGPCREAAWEQQTMIGEDLSTDSRWPRWAPQASALGLGSTLGVEMRAHGHRFGALNLYSADPRRYDPDEIALAHVFGRHAAIALAAAREEETLHSAIDARTLIGQAQGILMERFDIGAEQAFAVLQRYSQDQNTKLREVAEAVVDRRVLPPEGQGRDS